jgi:hypothetical protein
MFLYSESMKCSATRWVHIVLAVFFLTAAVYPACAGGENCSMPCCRHKAELVSHHMTDAPSKGCCTQPGDSSSDIGSGCAFDRKSLAPNLEPRTSVVPALEALGTGADNTPAGPAGSAPGLVEPSRPHKTPLYLRIQILLI